ncbi:ribosome biogenesis protein Nop16 [Xylariaceae sp. FL0594]|nr:ribosome biogenesis protein Nop16 [Xylariaceae sp. FL0594]
MGRELQKRKRRSSRPATRQPSSNRSKLTNPLGNDLIARNWNKNETMTQNYQRLGLVARLRAPTGGSELHKKNTSSSSSSTTLASKKKTSSSSSSSNRNPFAISGSSVSAAAASAPGTEEVRVERDDKGRILRVIRTERKKFNPLNDPLVEIESDSDASEGGDDAEEEWGGFEGEEQNGIVAQLESEANRPVEKKPRTQSQREAEWLQSLVDKHGDDTAAMARDRKLNPFQQTAADIARRIKKWKKESK